MLIDNLLRSIIKPVSLPYLSIKLPQKPANINLAIRKKVNIPPAIIPASDLLVETLKSVIMSGRNLSEKADVIELKREDES